MFNKITEIMKKTKRQQAEVLIKLCISAEINYYKTHDEFWQRRITSYYKEYIVLTEKEMKHDKFYKEHFKYMCEIFDVEF